jgi:hypothetical protein
MSLTGEHKVESRNLLSNENFPLNDGWSGEERPKKFGKPEILNCPYKKASRTSLVCQKFGKKLPMFDIYFPLFGIIMISVWLIASINHLEDDLVYILESWEIDQSCRGNNHISDARVIIPLCEQIKTSMNPSVHTSCVKVKPINLILPWAELDQTQWI